MVATTDCVEKSKSGNKVSKPLMEKKRRARINKCLDQLKSLLESYYSSSIRKRKLEKADILELTVKHLRNLQKIRSFACLPASAAAADFPDYQTGFQSCLANFNQYLLMADNLTGRDCWMLSQLSSKLCRSRGGGDCSSTMDSGRGQADTQDQAHRCPAPAAPEEGEAVPVNPGMSRLLPDEVARQSPGSKQPVLVTNSKKQVPPKRPSCKRFDSSSHSRNEVSSSQHSVWRPW
ncbi:hairy-related 3 [Aulostomus maculatus]